MLAKRLLELTEEFMNVDANAALLDSVGFEPMQGRSKDDIAQEYGKVLIEFLASQQTEDDKRQPLVS